MALKPDRHEVVTDISFFMNETAERGVIVVHNTAGSGAAMDDGNAVVQIPTTGNGQDFGDCNGSGNSGGMAMSNGHGGL